jgi:hypothetical protein
MTTPVTALSPLPKLQFFANNGSGAPLSFGKIWTYAAGTLNPQATYTSGTGLSANANPIILDANGQANIWLDVTLFYKYDVQDSNSVSQYIEDNISSAGGGSGSSGTTAIANGGTGQVTASAAFNALSPLSVKGDMLYESNTGVSSALSIGTTKQGLIVTAGLPVWSPIANTFNTRTGDVVLNSTDVTTALSYTPANLHAAQTFTGTQTNAVTVLTPSALVVTPDFSLNNNFSLTPTATFPWTMANPINAVAGTQGQIAVTQNGTPAGAVSFGTSWVAMNGMPITSVAGVISLINYYVVNSTTIWYSIGNVNGASTAGPPAIYNYSVADTGTLTRTHYGPVYILYSGYCYTGSNNPLNWDFYFNGGAVYSRHNGVNYQVMAFPTFGATYTTSGAYTFRVLLNGDTSQYNTQITVFEY